MRIGYLYCLGLASVVLCICSNALSEGPHKSKTVFAGEFRALEGQAINILKKNFSRSEVLGALIERYVTSDENATYVANFNAIMGYLGSTFVPDLVSPTAQEQAALAELKKIESQHDQLQLEYQEIYKKLPSFD